MHVVQARIMHILKGSPDWTVRLNAYIVHVVQARNMHRLDRVGDILDIYSTRCTGSEHASFR